MFARVSRPLHVWTTYGEHSFWDQRIAKHCRAGRRFRRGQTDLLLGVFRNAGPSHGQLKLGQYGFARREPKVCFSSHASALFKSTALQVGEWTCATRLSVSPMENLMYLA